MRWGFGVITGITGSLLNMMEQKIITGNIAIETALKAGVSAGIGAGFNFNPLGKAIPDYNLFNAAKFGSNPFFHAVSQQAFSAARIAVADQMIELARTGKFDLTEILASISSQLLSNGLPTAHNLFEKFAEGMLAGAGSALLTSVFTGRPPTPTDIAARALGTGMISGGMAVLQEAQEAMAKEKCKQCISKK